MSALPVTNNAPGDELSTKNRALLAGASMVQVSDTAYSIYTMQPLTPPARPSSR